MRRPFDWARDAAGDLTRCFPPVVGRGRGVVLGAAVSLRDRLLWLQGRDREVTPGALERLNAERES